MHSNMYHRQPPEERRRILNTPACNVYTDLAMRSNGSVCVADGESGPGAAHRHQVEACAEAGPVLQSDDDAFQTLHAYFIDRLAI
jgi:hypothetical protein